MSPDGVSPGHHSLDMQAFIASVANFQEAIEHIITQTSLMEGHNKADLTPPHILFLSKSCADDDQASALRKKVADLGNYFRPIMKDPRILKLIKEVKLAIIPVLTTERTRIVKHIAYDLCIGNLRTSISF